MTEDELEERKRLEREFVYDNQLEMPPDKPIPVWIWIVILLTVLTAMALNEKFKWFKFRKENVNMEIYYQPRNVCSGSVYIHNISFYVNILSS